MAQVSENLKEWPHTILTRRDAIEWICYVLGIRGARYIPATRKMLESATLERVEKEYNDFFGSVVHFTVIDGEHQLYPISKMQMDIARERNKKYGT